MVASDFNILGNTGEKALAVVFQARGFSVHESSGSDDIAAEMLSDRLVAKADAKNRLFAGERFDHRNAHARFVGRARSGGNENAAWVERLGFFDGDFVVAIDALLDSQRAEILHEIVCEGVVVVDDEQHGLGRSLNRAKRVGSRAMKD